MFHNTLKCGLYRLRCKITTNILMSQAIYLESVYFFNYRIFFLNNNYSLDARIETSICSVRARHSE